MVVYTENPYNSTMDLLELITYQYHGIQHHKINKTNCIPMYCFNYALYSIFLILSLSSGLADPGGTTLPRLANS